jgi:hypothetical protein
MNEAKAFVKRLYPTAVYNPVAFWVSADTVENNKKRTYILGVGGTERNAWIHAEHHLKNRVLRKFEQ